MVDWYYIYSILPLGVYPFSKTIYNVHAEHALQEAWNGWTLEDKNLG